MPEIDNDKTLKDQISKELADVFVYAIAMSVILELDIESIVKGKLAIAAKKYPAEVVKNSSLKQYLELKKSNRAKGI